MISNISVNLNDIKSAQVQWDLENAKLLIRIYSNGILVGYYNRYDLNKLLSQLLSITNRSNKNMLPQADFRL